MKLKQLLKNKLNKTQLNLVPGSFDIVGNIIIFSDFPKELKSKEKLIATTLLKSIKNIATVAKKTKIYSGVYRTPKLKIIAGEKTKETIHKENNIKVKLNVETCYFSPRLSTERLRISSLIKKPESVLVMFSGVAIYPLVIEKNSKVKEIYAIEINPNAHKYALENLKLNKSRKIKLFKGDVKKILPRINKKFDRILMPLPKGAEPFLKLAFKKIKKNGIIHFYDFQQKDEFKSSVEKIKKYNKNIKILKIIKCGQLSPRKYRICVDLKVL